MERRGTHSDRIRARACRNQVVRKNSAVLAWLLAVVVVLLGILLPCLLLRKQETNWMKQSEWISYEQILPLQFDQTLNFVERKAVNGELWLEEAEEACRVQLEILLENGALTAGYYWPAALELQSGLLAEEQPVWQLIFCLSEEGSKTMGGRTAVLEVQMDALNGQIYQVGYMEMQMGADEALEKNNAYIAVQNFVYPYLGREGVILESSDDRQASMLLDDGSFVYYCCGEAPWYQYVAILDAHDYERTEELRDAWLNRQQKTIYETIL